MDINLNDPRNFQQIRKQTIYSTMILISIILNFITDLLPLVSVLNMFSLISIECLLILQIYYSFKNIKSIPDSIVKERLTMTHIYIPTLNNQMFNFEYSVAKLIDVRQFNILRCAMAQPKNFYCDIADIFKIQIINNLQYYLSEDSRIELIQNLDSQDNYIIFNEIIILKDQYWFDSQITNLLTEYFNNTAQESIITKNNELFDQFYLKDKMKYINEEFNKIKCNMLSKQKSDELESQPNFILEQNPNSKFNCTDIQLKNQWRDKFQKQEDEENQKNQSIWNQCFGITSYHEITHSPLDTYLDTWCKKHHSINSQNLNFISIVKRIEDLMEIVRLEDFNNDKKDIACRMNMEDQSFRFIKCYDASKLPGFIDRSFKSDDQGGEDYISFDDQDGDVETKNQIAQVFHTQHDLLMQLQQLQNTFGTLFQNEILLEEHEVFVNVCEVNNLFNKEEKVKDYKNVNIIISVLKNGSSYFNDIEIFCHVQNQIDLQQCEKLINRINSFQEKQDDVKERIDEQINFNDVTKYIRNILL